MSLMVNLACSTMSAQSIIHTMGFKLVIVDDAAFIREAIKSLLAGSEIQCVGEAADGEEALRVIERCQPDVVILDLILPKKNGIEVAAELMRKKSKAQVIACSTEGQEGLMIQAIDAGCNNFLTKPFTAESLKKVLFAALAKPPKIRAADAS